MQLLLILNFLIVCRFKKIQDPFRGYAIYFNALEMLPNIPQSEYPAQLLEVELYIDAGVRGAEIGTLLADKDPITGKERYPELELLRLAIPRRVYSIKHMDYIASAMKNLKDRAHEFKSGFRIKKQAEILRHFTVELERI